MESFQQRLRALGHVCYDDYLKSFHWAQFKRSYRASGLPTVCAVCGATAKLNFHHNTYDRLGEEVFSDITLLCERHHDQVHACLLASGWGVVRTPDAVESLRGGQTFALDDLMKKRAKVKSKKESRPKVGHRPSKRRRPKQGKQRRKILGKLKSIKGTFPDLDIFSSWASIESQQDIDTLIGSLKAANKQKDAAVEKKRLNSAKTQREQEAARLKKEQKEAADKAKRKRAEEERAAYDIAAARRRDESDRRIAFLIANKEKIALEQQVEKIKAKEKDAECVTFSRLAMRERLAKLRK